MKVIKTAVINPILKIKNLTKKMSRSSKITKVMQTSIKMLKMVTRATRALPIPKIQNPAPTSPSSFVLPLSNL